MCVSSASTGDNCGGRPAYGRSTEARGIAGVPAGHGDTPQHCPPMPARPLFEFGADVQGVKHPAGCRWFQAMERARKAEILLRLQVAPRIRVWLNPALNLSELPLKSFFRFALPDMSTGSHMTALQANLWDETEDMPGAPSAVFTNLPQKKILTLNLHPPEVHSMPRLIQLLWIMTCAICSMHFSHLRVSNNELALLKLMRSGRVPACVLLQAWLVEPVRAVHDTDNLLLADLPDGDSMATADFELEAMIISGSCIDIGASSRKQARIECDMVVLVDP